MSPDPRRILRGLRSYTNGLPARMVLDARAELIHAEYRARRERYDRAANERGLAYDPRRVIERTSARLSALGITPRSRTLGEVHTLAFVPMMSWHAQLLPPLRALGPLSHFDYVAHGVEPNRIWARDPAALQSRRAANDAFVEFAKQVGDERPVDWVFVYANGIEVLAATLARVREVTGAPVVGMCLDDKQSWEAAPYGEQRPGQIDIVAQLDVGWTSARVVCEWYMIEGGNPLFLGEGCSPDLYHPSDAPSDIDVSFVGQCYGFRQAFVADLVKAGIRVEAAGRGWPRGSISEAEMIKLFQRSRIVLGHGGIGWSESVKNVKGRDFDGPCMGSGAYVTTFNPDLTPFFTIGDEIACYSTRDEAVETIRTLLRDDDRRREIARRGRERCLREHTWVHRFTAVLRTLGVLPADGA